MHKIIVGFSGGADSQACALWCRRKFGEERVILLFSDPGGNENALTYGFVNHYSSTVHPVITVKPTFADLAKRQPKAFRESGFKLTDELTFVRLAQIKGRFPSTKARFCTEFLKLYPQRRWMEEHQADLLMDGYERYIGVRRDESKARGEALEREWDDFFDCYLNRPLIHWTKQDVFAYLQEGGEDFNPLYKMGQGRVGCSPCINSGKSEIREWAARFPEEVARIRAWEKMVGRTFFPPCLPGGRYAFIDEVIAWSKTEHGGKQISLPFVEAAAESHSCSSKYGLCE